MDQLLLAIVAIGIVIVITRAFQTPQPQIIYVQTEIPQRNSLGCLLPVVIIILAVLALRGLLS